jgi:hypothetical protein
MLKSAALMFIATIAFAQTCQTIKVADSRANGNTADDIAVKLNNIAEKTTILALGTDKLLVCADAANFSLIQSAVAAFAEPVSAAQPESHSTRLFFNRDAASFANALNKVFNVPVDALGKDTLIFSSTKPEDDEHIRDLKRWVAVLDTPRPEVTIDAWSVQVSSPSAADVTKIAAAVRKVVYESDELLHDSLQRGWTYLNTGRFNPSFPAPLFSSYLLKRFVNGKTEGTYSDPAMAHCGEGTYCLGYGNAFSDRMPPSLSNMIGILAGARSQDLINPFVDCLEGRRSCSEMKPAAPENQGEDKKAQQTAVIAPYSGGCEAEDERSYSEGPISAPAFNCFRRQLLKSFQPAQLLLLRTAMADYLFQYKFAIQYPHDFSSYDYTSSAEQLDTQLDPVLVAFNHDVVMFLRQVQCMIQKPDSKQKSGKLSFSSNGIVTVKTISGSEGAVNTGTQSAFAATPVPLVQDFLKNLSAQSSTTPSGVISRNLPPNAGQALLAFLNSSQPVTAMIGRDLNLDVTPVTLPGASSAELTVTLEAKDDGTASIVTNGTPQNDTTDRVTNHKVATTVRVDSLKLFEISTFSAELTRGRDPIPLLPPFVQLPYIGSFATWKLKPSRVYHQSFAIVNATILPTAADLLNGLRFHEDKTNQGQGEAQEEPVYALSVNERRALTKSILKFHETMMDCIAWEANPTKTIPAACRQLESVPGTEAYRR